MCVATPAGLGRFAPSPSGELHVGNLRTALLAWLFARTSGRRIALRIEDLDARTSADRALGQISDLDALGLTFDGPVVWQSTRLPAYLAAVSELRRRDLIYPCFCSRREIREAPSAPHAPPGAYPGTCRDLAAGQIARRSRDRDPAWRLRAHGAQATIEDVLHGHYAGPVDDFVLLRGDGVPAYNLAAVVDDGQMGVDQVVRGDDLLSSAPRQHYLAKLLGFEPVEYAHVPLALGPSGFRLAKRDGAVTLSQLARAGIVPSDVLCTMANSLGLAAPKEPVTLELLARRFDPARLPREPWVVRTGAAEGL